MLQIGIPLRCLGKHWTQTAHHVSERKGEAAQSQVTASTQTAEPRDTSHPVSRGERQLRLRLRNYNF